LFPLFPLFLPIFFPSLKSFLLSLRPLPPHGPLLITTHPTLFTPKAHPFLLAPAASPHNNSFVQNRPFKSLSPLALSDNHPHHGPLLFIWYPNQMVHGVLVVIIVV
jgi:hypothetical protein